MITWLGSHETMEFLSNRVVYISVLVFYAGGIWNGFQLRFALLFGLDLVYKRIGEEEALTFNILQKRQ